MRVEKLRVARLNLRVDKKFASYGASCEMRVVSASCELRVENLRVASVNLRVEICELRVSNICELQSFAHNSIPCKLNDPTLLKLLELYCYRKFTLFPMTLCIYIKYFFISAGLPGLGCDVLCFECGYAQ